MKKFRDQNPSVETIMNCFLEAYSSGKRPKEYLLVCSSEGLEALKKDISDRTIGLVELEIPEDVPVEISIAGELITICVTHNLSDGQWIIS